MRGSPEPESADDPESIRGRLETESRLEERVLMGWDWDMNERGWGWG